jgi:hypothetical protein
MTPEEQVPEFYVDQFMVTTGVYGVAMTFGLTPPHPAPGQSATPRDLVRLRMSLEHAKIMTMLLRRHLKSYERDNGISIEVPSNVYTGLGVSLEDW